jgi:PPM family protein phosphatase
MMQPGQPTASSTRLRIEFAQATDPGRDPNKQVNEDACGYAETRLGHLCVLCDGMGGHYGGKEASRMAITTIFEVMEQTPPNVTPAQALKAAIEEAGRRVYHLGGPPENRTRPGSTVVVMLLHDRGIDVAHVGDSRAYVIRQGQIYPLTRDHSMVQGMIDAGMLTEEQAIGHPDANKITRALGMKPEVEVEVRPEPMELFAGDVLLQSSDGLTDLALGADILGATRQALSSGGVQHACNMLVQLANARGGHDNITVQMARVVDVGSKASLTIPGGPSPVGRAPEAVQATAHDARQAYGGGRSGPPPTMPQMPAMAWNPPGPTEMTEGGTEIMGPLPEAAAKPWHDPASAGPIPGQAGTPHIPATLSPTPTIAEHGPVSQPWTSGMYNGPPPASRSSPAPFSSYRIEAGAEPAALPLPPPSGYASAGNTQVPVSSSYRYGLPSSIAAPTAQPSRGGIVFVIIGVSTMIAILALVVLWALFR